MFPPKSLLYWHPWAVEEKGKILARTSKRKDGDKSSPLPFLGAYRYPQQCRDCLASQPSLCLNGRDAGTLGSKEDKSVMSM